jgi:hypothetical protein
MAGVVRASMGAIFRVPVEIDVPLDALPARFSRIACLDPLKVKGRVRRLPPVRVLPVWQREARGSAARGGGPGARSPFPVRGAIESLNVAATVNICLYEINRPPAREPGSKIRDFGWCTVSAASIGVPVDAVSGARQQLSRIVAEREGHHWILVPCAM